VERTDLHSIADLEQRLPVGERIQALLRTGARSAKAIAEELDLEEKPVRARLSELQRDAKVVRLDTARGGAWGLAATHHATRLG
jgi:predicted ArsR family transcriptional regulator